MIIECTSSTVASFSNSFLVISTLPARLLPPTESLDTGDPGGECMDGRPAVVEGGAVEAGGGGSVVEGCGSEIRSSAQDSVRNRCRESEFIRIRWLSNVWSDLPKLRDTKIKVTGPEEFQQL
jgi:hypothetical protein